MNKLHNKIRVTEIGDIANRLVSLYKGTATLQDDAFLKAIFKELETQGVAITNAVKKDTAVSNLDSVDIQRDKAIRVLDKLLKGYEHIPIQELKAHGEKLSAIFKKYGVKIINENYSSQSNLIDSLLMDFSADGVQQSVKALLGVSEAIEGIRTAQDHFNKARSQYENNVVQQQSKVTASSLRKPLLEVINKKLVPYLVAMHLVDATKYSAFVSESSKIIVDMNEVIKARAKKKIDDN